jgi:hypothetical protein
VSAGTAIAIGGIAIIGILTATVISIAAITGIENSGPVDERRRELDTKTRKIDPKPT